MSNNENKMKWKFAGAENVEYEFLTAEEALKNNDQGGSVALEIEKMVSKFNQVIRLDAAHLDGENSGETQLFIYQSNFMKFDKAKRGGRPKDDYACLTVRKDERLIGFMTFETSGYLEAAMLERGERKNDIPQKGEGQNVSEHLFRLAVSILLAKYNCGHIFTTPASERGEGVDKSNGFYNSGMDSGHFCFDFRLDQRIIDRAKRFLAEHKGGDNIHDLISKLKEDLDPIINEVAKEIKEHHHREVDKMNRIELVGRA